jgi:hypothetical protein
MNGQRLNDMPAPAPLATSAGLQPAVSRIWIRKAPRDRKAVQTANRRYRRVRLCATAAGACALALALLLTTFSASALQISKAGQASGQAKAWTPNSFPARSTLTPATPAPSQVPASSREDIRDIRQPRHLPTPLAWAAAAAGVIILCAAAFAAWKRLRPGKLLSPTPSAAALRQLEAARRLMDPEHAREYCFAASQIIRSYLELQFCMHAPRLTTEEFLRDLVEVRESMLASHRALLGDFLQHCDLAKFAGWRYSAPALEDMHNTAVDFVRHTAAPGVKTTQPMPDEPQKDHAPAEAPKPVTIATA